MKNKCESAQCVNVSVQDGEKDRQIGEREGETKTETDRQIVCVCL